MSRADYVVVDVLTPDQRRRCMSRIRRRDTKPEIKLRQALWRMGLRYRVDLKIPGRPDIAFVGKKVAVFVDGCFWHGCPEHGRVPSDEKGYWAAKIQGNKDRDQRVDAKLAELGWVVVRFWEHELKRDLEKVAAAVADIIRAEGLFR